MSSAAAVKVVRVYQLNHPRRNFLGTRRNVVVFVKSGEWIVQYQEDRSYTSPVTGLQASNYGNAYYHLQLECTHVQHGQHLHRVTL